MTPTEYAREMGTKLRGAYNGRDPAAVDSLFELADATLVRSALDGHQRQIFWSEVRKAFFAGRLLIEKQANSSLHALMRNIEAAIAERLAGK
jgi:hypothetical protein